MSLEDAREMVQGLLAALKEQESAVVTSLQIYGKSFPSKVKRLFDKEKYAADSKRIKRLAQISSTWVKRKRNAGFQTKRGHATGGASKAIGHKKAIKTLPKGFEYDVMIPASRITADYSIMGGKKQRVSAYLAHYRNAKAPGFPSFSKNQVDEMVEAEAVASMNLYNDAMNGVAARMEQQRLSRSTFQRFRVDIGNDILPEFEVKL